MDDKIVDQLRKEYPHYIKLDVAGRYLGVSPRRPDILYEENSSETTRKSTGLDPPYGAI